jgi:predicted HD phosphohydrolase
MQSLRLQGGAFSLKEVKQFEQNPYYREAVRLRRWDDAAKVAGLPVPGLERYRARMEKVLIKSLIQSQS